MTYSFPFNADQKLIELGGGANPTLRPNMDFRPGPTVDIVGDLSQPLPFEAASFDGVLCTYALEHISWRKVKEFIAEVYRILRNGGKAVFITANLREQAKRLVNTEEWTDNEVCMIFGDQDYLPGNMHLTGFSEQSAIRLFREAGFSQVMVMPHPNTITDMIIEVTKHVADDPNRWDTDRRTKAFGSDYFNGGQLLGGYAGIGYWDYPVHHLTYELIKQLNPTSVLELGCARGYILKRLEDSGIPVVGLEVSKHCYQTRVCNGIITWDITQTPWPIPDQSIDLAYSVAALEHIPEQYIPAIAGELARTCRRGIHGVDLSHGDWFDRTHTTIKDLNWWSARLTAHQSAVNKEALEAGAIRIPGPDGLIKLNLGCHTVMFHHGWFNIDKLDLTQFAGLGAYQFVQHDVTKGIPFGDHDVHVIYASHLLEHLSPTEGLKLLKECRRVLCDGGVVRLAVPDTRLLASKYLDGTLGEFDEISDENANTPESSFKLWNLLTGGHQTAYDESSLTTLLRNAGFHEVYKRLFRQSGTDILTKQTLDMFPEHSLYIEAVATR